MNGAAPGTTEQDSRATQPSRPTLGGFDVLGTVLAAAAFLGAVLLILSDFLTLFTVTTEAGVEVPDGAVRGHENHSFAMVLVGLAALPMAYGASAGGSRPAMAGLTALGLLAVVISLAFDLPDATGTNTLARTFENAVATPRAGFYTQTLGAVLLLVAGASSLILTAPDRRRRENAAADSAAERAQARARDRGDG